MGEGGPRVCMHSAFGLDWSNWEGSNDFDVVFYTTCMTPTERAKGIYLLFIASVVHVDDKVLYD